MSLSFCTLGLLSSLVPSFLDMLPLSPIFVAKIALSVLYTTDLKTQGERASPSNSSAKISKEDLSGSSLVMCPPLMPEKSVLRSEVEHLSSEVLEAGGAGEGSPEMTKRLLTKEMLGRKLASKLAKCI